MASLRPLKAVWVLAVFVLFAVSASAQTSKLYTFNMTAVASSCESVEVGQALESEMTVEKSGRVYTVNPFAVGVSSTYSGYRITNGFTAALQSSCPVVPEPVCSTRAETITALKQGAGAGKYKVVWIVIERDSENKFECSVVYTGKASPTPTK